MTEAINRMVSPEIKPDDPHDGAIRPKTLDEVIDFYSSGLVNSPYVDPLMHYISYGGNMLTPAEKADLKAFLLSLTDEDFIKNPALSKPEALKMK